ncbi:hypothetical protein BpHYR1_014799 [Brachionus plicatilis]|uniref:Uncharacterized protein n=1 Tax=Brachionus plicatilis TaxID=10195 RepID=A0A3M7ST12_BRAPC|nr:hypothetical protein BpHYR1_014799 [Brachionus plicatilis]
MTKHLDWINGKSVCTSLHIKLIFLKRNCEIVYGISTSTELECMCLTGCLVTGSITYMSSERGASYLTNSTSKVVESSLKFSLNSGGNPEPST